MLALAPSIPDKFQESELLMQDMEVNRITLYVLFGKWFDSLLICCSALNIVRGLLISNQLEKHLKILNHPFNSEAVSIFF